MSIQDREEAYLIVEVEEAIMDDIDYDLCLVGLTIRAIGDSGLYCIQFYQAFGPLIIVFCFWSFNNPKSVDLFFADFRVKVHDLSSGFAFENLDKSLSNIMGMLKYDAVGGRNVLNNFMKIWVRLDTKEPLMRRKKLHHPKGSYF
ncbi:hypothetical protein Gogos_008459, partial [Gossypium gossypioides]|nr:hypothetical protein [Gossypium gossypioides]